MADDSDLLTRIEADLAEERELRSRHETQGSGGPLSSEDRQRLSQLEVHLDQLWDLLRQRRARREAGQDEGDVEQRPADVVESYRN